MSRTEILTFIHTCNDKDLLSDINTACCDQMKHLGNIACQIAKTQYRKGMTVKFRGNRRQPGPHTGTIKRLCAKTMKVEVGFSTWTIPLDDKSIQILEA